MVQCSVPLCSAARGPRWVYESPETAIHDPASAEEWLNQDPYTDLSFRLVPSEDPFYYALLDDTIVHKTGRRATVAARDAMEVLVETISWGYPPSIFHDFTTFVIKVDPTVSWTNIGTSPLIGARSLHHLCEKPIDPFQCIRPIFMNAAVGSRNISLNNGFAQPPKGVSIYYLRGVLMPIIFGIRPLICSMSTFSLLQ